MEQIAITTALKKIKQTLYEPTFYKVIQGGMSSSKTFSIMILLISYAESYPNSLVTVAGMETLVSLDDAMNTPSSTAVTV